VEELNGPIKPAPAFKPLFPWPVRYLGPAPGLKEINLICWGLFLGLEILPFFVPLWTHSKTGTAFSSLLPVDFTYFYGIGRIVHEYTFARLYDYNLQLQIFNQIDPLKDNTYGPSPYPPFVALFFSLFARIPFVQAYLLWVVTSLALYLTGIAQVVKAVYPRERLKASLIFCFSLEFYPFFICTLKLGQLSSIAVFSVGLAVAEEKRSRPFVSGLALSILTYKPTLLLLIVPMLLITRRFKALLGFVIGSSVLVLIATAFAGVGIWPVYAHFLSYFRQASVFNGQSLLQLWEYIDFSSLTYSIPGGRSSIGLAFLAALTVSILAVLAVLLWKSTGRGGLVGRPVQDLVWATTLTWTLLLNVYVPVWDSILVTIAVILTLGALRDLGWTNIAGWILFLSLLIFAVTWNLAAKTNHGGSRRMTVLLFIVGVVQMIVLHRANSAVPKVYARNLPTLYPSRSQ